MDLPAKRKGVRVAMTAGGFAYISCLSCKALSCRQSLLNERRSRSAGDVTTMSRVMESARLTPATETRMLTRKKLMKAPFNDSQSQVAEKALRLDNKNR